MFAVLLALLIALSLAFTGDADAEPDDPVEPDKATEGDDSLTGSAGPDLIDGLAGDDTIDGGVGDDTLLGSEGDDWLRGGAGNDQLSGGDGNDQLDLGAGINTLDGGLGDDTLTMADGFESLYHYDDQGRIVSVDQSLLDGGDGGETEGDLLDASSTMQALHLYVDDDRSFIATSPRWERIAQIDGFERYALGSGPDVVEYYRTGGAIQIDTGAGDDALYLLNGNHQVRTGSGDDEVSFTAEGAFASGLALDGGEGEQTRGDFLQVYSDQALDMIIDASGSGTISDGAGGALRFENFERFDISGPQTHIDASAAAFDLDIHSFYSDSTLIGGSGDDTLSGDVALGGAGDDQIAGGAYADGGEGNDTVSADIALGGDGNDIVDGYSSAQGGNGDDEVHSQGTAEGGAGNDTVSGHVMTGGEGIDHFAADTTIRDGVAVGASDVITDYEPGESVALTITYNNTDFDDPTVSVPAPTFTIEQDSVAHEVRVLVNGETALTVQGTDSIPDGLLEITTQGYNPWDDPNYTP